MLINCQTVVCQKSSQWIGFLFIFYKNVNRISQQNIGLECPFKSHEYLCFYSQVINFLYYAKDSHFVYECRCGSHYFPLLLYNNLCIIRIKLEVNLNKNTWVMGINAWSGSARVVRELSAFWERERDREREGVLRHMNWIYSLRSFDWRIFKSYSRLFCRQERVKQRELFTVG